MGVAFAGPSGEAAVHGMPVQGRSLHRWSRSLLQRSVMMGSANRTARRQATSANRQEATPFVVGSRVEVSYRDKWYVGTVVDIPINDKYKRWRVQCDVDRPGRLTKSHQVRLAGVGSRVEAKYKSKWYKGTVTATPQSE